jgi:hypothetical protein
MDDFLYAFSLIVRTTGFHLLCLLALTFEWLSKLWQLFIVMGHDHDTERPQWGPCSLVLPGTYTAELVRHISPQRRRKCLSSTGSVTSNLTQISMQSILVRDATSLRFSLLLTSSSFKHDPSIADRADPADRVPDPSTSVSQASNQQTSYLLTLDQVYAHKSYLPFFR